MKKEIININNNIIVNVNSNKILLNNYKSAMEFLLDINFKNNSTKIILNKEIFSKDFFNLKLQLFDKIYKNLMYYKINLVIIGDFDQCDIDFTNYIYNSNKNKKIYFLSNTEEALYILR